ncbi:hypothetical protein [Paenibacillus silvae]|uniref:hypothetical protein n=1 Tax=Paenibacillus silvae TaxID=1325358 RepID=UPI0020061969|nr:hypothetical protein [Paenibacillus silvae]MCK6077896.1 hypothetical protein [Paenibacillus silvae]MCK6152095.1 hypothetical protein [Paenibacillus silvae]MCK6270780.1 hypothetical protein [Paenibacillus silvae]
MKGIGGALAMFTKKETDRKNLEVDQQHNDTQYNKAQFAEARQFSRLEKDILAAVLLEEKTYTVQEAQQHIQQFMNGEAQ